MRASTVRRSRLGNRLQDGSDIGCFRQGAAHGGAIVYDCARNPSDLVTRDQLRELGCLHDVGANAVALYGQLVSQAHGLGAVRSGRCSEDLQVDIAG